MLESVQQSAHILRDSELSKEEQERADEGRKRYAPTVAASHLPEATIGIVRLQRTEELRLADVHLVAGRGAREVGLLAEAERHFRAAEVTFGKYMLPGKLLEVRLASTLPSATAGVHVSPHHPLPPHRRIPACQMWWRGKGSGPWQLCVAHGTWS